jgi:hypothetical protein
MNVFYFRPYHLNNISYKEFNDLSSTQVVDFVYNNILQYQKGEDRLNNEFRRYLK